MSSISKFGKRCPCTDREDLRSSIGSTISIASEGDPEQAHTSVLNLTFQHENVERDLKFSTITHIISRINSFGTGWRIPG